MKCLLIVLFMVSISGCATVMHGTTQIIPISSEPDKAKVKLTNGIEYVTPANIELSRKNDHILTIAKDGYKSQQIIIMHVISGAVAGNILAGGLIGWGVDAASGAQYKLVPEIVNIKLEPMTGNQLTSEEKTQLDLTPETKLKKIEELKNQKLITEQEYESMRKIILDSIVNELLDDRDDVNFVDSDGATQLFFAAKNGQVDVVRMLLGRNVDVNTARKTDGATPLIMASQNGHTEIVKLLLDAKANVNTKAISRGKEYTPLSLAKLMGHNEVVKLLQEYGSKE